MIPPPLGQERVKGKVMETKNAYVYLLRSDRTNKFYIGYTTDLKKRLQEHNSGKSYYTASKGPWILIAYEIHADIESAKKREWSLKHSPRMLALFKKRALAPISLATRRTYNIQRVTQRWLG